MVLRRDRRPAALAVLLGAVILAGAAAIVGPAGFSCVIGYSGGSQATKKLHSASYSVEDSADTTMGKGDGLSPAGTRHRTIKIQ